MNLVQKMQYLYTVPVLQELNKCWQKFSNLRAICYTFPHSDMFLNILVTKVPNDRIISEEQLIQIMSSDNTVDVTTVKQLWGQNFDSDLVESCIKMMGRPEFFFTAIEKLQLQRDLTNNIHSDHDPIIKNILMMYRINMITKDFSNNTNILRILSVVFAQYLGILEHPILYHNMVLDTIVEILLLDENTKFDETNLLFILQSFGTLCYLGTSVLSIYHTKIVKSLEKIQEDAYLSKIFQQENIATYLFQNMIINIPSIMNKMNWKRDKSARFLTRLKFLDLLIEKKQGKDKYFITSTILNTFIELRDNLEIQKMIKKI